MLKLYFPVLLLAFSICVCFEAQAGLDREGGAGCSDACIKGYNTCMSICTNPNDLNLGKDTCLKICAHTGTDCNGGEPLKLN